MPGKARDGQHNSHRGVLFCRPPATAQLRAQQLAGPLKVAVQGRSFHAVLCTRQRQLAAHLPFFPVTRAPRSVRRVDWMPLQQIWPRHQMLRGERW